MIVRPCPHCRKSISPGVVFCPYCGKDESGRKENFSGDQEAESFSASQLESELRDLASEDPFVQDQAVERCVAKGAGVIPLLGDRLPGSGTTAALGIIKVLARLRDPRSVQVLLQALKETDEEIRAAALTALRPFHDDAVLQALLVEAEGNHPALQGYAASLLGSFRDPRVLPTLARLTHHRQSEVAFQAIWALGELGDPAAIPVLQKALWRREKNLQSAAKTALHRLGGSTRRPWLGRPALLWGLLTGVVMLAGVVLWWVYR